MQLRLFAMQVASSNASVQAERLPPTLAATKYHFQRCYLQIMKWQDRSNFLKPEESSWRLSSSQNMYLLIMIDASTSTRKYAEYGAGASAMAGASLSDAAAIGTVYPAALSAGCAKGR